MPNMGYMCSDEEALQILADLHGEGHKDNPLVQLEYTEITQQVQTGSEL